MTRKPTTTSNWAERPIDSDFLVDSGLLFEINRTILHLAGLALEVVTEEGGVAQLVLKDRRGEPEVLVFDAGSFVMGKERLERFRTEFLRKQLARRENKLGYGCQWTTKQERKKESK